MQARNGGHVHLSFPVRKEDATRLQTFTDPAAMTVTSAATGGSFIFIFS
jgi:hypothetical protein